MGSGEERRSMAHYVQAEHMKTRERLAKRPDYPVPQIGDIIIFNEIQKYHDKHDCLPRRGVGVVKAVYGCNIIIDKLHKKGYFFNTSIRSIDFKLGLYRYLKLKSLPKDCPSFLEMDLSKLGNEMKALVIGEEPVQCVNE